MKKGYTSRVKYSRYGTESELTVLAEYYDLDCGPSFPPRDPFHHPS